MSPQLIDALPDLTLLVRRDGTIVEHVGGRGVGALMLTADAVDRPLDAVWPEAAATTVKQLIRRAIAGRRPVESLFKLAAVQYEARVEAQGPDRAVCTLRIVLTRSAIDDSSATGEMLRPELDRRGFLKRYHATMSLAALQERQAAVAVIQLEGIAEIAGAVDVKVSETVLSAALLRIPGNLAADEHPPWFLGQLNESMLAIVIESSNRAAIDALTNAVCLTLRAPVGVGDAEFQLTPYAGVAILGRDASAPKGLLDYARSASSEARRAGSAQPQFFTDTLRLRSIARLDITCEMSEAIENGAFQLRYVGRHDLITGRLLAQVGYLHWHHPLRGDVRPAEFLAVAETTGVAVRLSRVAMQQLRVDFTAAGALLEDDVKLSLGPLRHHVLHDEFVADVAALLAGGSLPAERVELRIAERSFVALDSQVCRKLRRLGVQIVIDEMGRSLGSLDRLARAPIHGVQLDRAWVTAVARDDLARRVCRAGVSAATALGLVPIATGVDDDDQRRTLLELGCSQGGGDFYAGNRFDQQVRGLKPRPPARRFA